MSCHKNAIYNRKRIYSFWQVHINFKTACTLSEELDQPAHPAPDQSVRFGQRSSGEDCSDCADAQADLNLH